MSGPPVILFDNGSVRAASHLLLRKVANQLAADTGAEVLAASLAHSDRVTPDELGGTPAMLLTSQVEKLYARGDREIACLPFLLSPGGAIGDIFERQREEMQSRLPDLQLHLLPGLFVTDEKPDPCLAEVLVDRARQRLEEIPAEDGAAVVMVDHGSPVPVSAMVRNFVGGQVSLLLPSDKVRCFSVASMERRPGERYDFNEPLLETVLERWAPLHQRVVVLLFFLGPGRHAGEDGDIMQICNAVRERHPGLQTLLTEPMGDHQSIIGKLARTLRQMGQR